VSVPDIEVIVTRSLGEYIEIEIQIHFLLGELNSRSGLAISLPDEKFPSASQCAINEAGYPKKENEKQFLKVEKTVLSSITSLPMPTQAQPRESRCRQDKCMEAPIPMDLGAEAEKKSPLSAFDSHAVGHEAKRPSEIEHRQFNVHNSPQKKNHPSSFQNPLSPIDMDIPSNILIVGGGVFGRKFFSPATITHNSTPENQTPITPAPLTRISNDSLSPLP